MLCVNIDKFTFYRNQYKWTNVVHTLLSGFSYSAYFDIHLCFEYCELNFLVNFFRDGQGSQVCWSPWGCKESDTTELLNWTENRYTTVCLPIHLLIDTDIGSYPILSIRNEFLMKHYVQVFARTCAIICLGYLSILQFGGLVTKLCLTIGTPWTIALQVPLSMGFSRKEYRSGCHFLLQGIFPTQESNPGLLHCREILYWLSYKGNRLLKSSYNILHCNQQCVRVLILPNLHQQSKSFQFSFS